MKAPYTEARRYITNAEELLPKAGRENGLYKDKKYVKMAGNTAWNGVLVALDEWLKNKGVHRPKKRRYTEWYESEISKRNRKLNTLFVTAYDGLHLSMGYDGNLLVKNAQGSLELAKQIISLCNKDS